MRTRLMEHYRKMVLPPAFHSDRLAGDPDNFGGNIASGWCWYIHSLFVYHIISWLKTRVNTWANLPYRAVWKSGHRTAKVGSLNHTFFCGLKLPTLAVSRPRSQTADLGSFMASFQHFGPFGPQTADLGSFMAAFQPFALSMTRLMFSNCRPWQFHGRFSALWSQTADLGSFMAGFQHTGGFGPQTADLGSFMATFQPYQIKDLKNALEQD